MKTKHFLLCCIAVLCCISTFAHDFKVDGIYYNKLGGDSVAVTYRGSSYNSYNNEYSSSVTIPTTVEYNSTTYRVTSIGDRAFYYCFSLTSVTIPNSVTSIGEWAFSDCSSLTSITIPDGVTSIGEWAFSDCSSLTEVTIPNSVTTIGNSAFYGCSSLTAPIYNDHMFAFLPTNHSGVYTIPNGITSIAGGAFSGCTSLTSVTIPNSVTSIGDNAFSGCSSLTDITWNAKSCTSTPFSVIASQITSFTFGEEVTAIPASLCKNMGNLTAITIPNNVKEIGAYAFYSCTNLTTANILNDDVIIGEYAFTNCPLLYNRFDNAKYLAVGKNKYHTLIEAKDKEITSCVIYPKTQVIGGKAFESCQYLTEIEIPETVTEIKEGAFSSCSSLSQINIPNNVTTIGSNVFYNCSALQTLTIGKNVTKIGYSCFSGCSNLSSIVIPNSVTTLGNSVFLNCTRLTLATLSDNLSTISKYAFACCSNLTSITIPNNVDAIQAYAFFGCQSLSSIAIPEGVTTIGASAFANCTKLPYLLLPNTLTSLGNSAFANCTTIAAIKVENPVPPTCTSAFTSLSKETPISVPCGALDTYLSNTEWTAQFKNFVESDYLFVAQSENENKGEVIVMLNPTCDDPMAMMRVVPKDGYKFVAWNDGNTETMRTVEVTEDVIYTARFNSIDTPDTIPQDDVTIETTPTTAGITWQPIETANAYSLVVFADSAMTDTVCTMTFDAYGNLLTQTWTARESSARRKVQQRVSELDFVVTDLEENTTYSYMLRSYDCNNMILETVFGTFRTASITNVIDSPTILQDNNIRKVFENGTLYILRNGEKYTIDGRKVK